MSLRLCILPLLLALTVATASPARPQPADADPSVYRSDEVTLRLVRGIVGADGVMRGALLVELAPGWKTYWIDPGDAGIPPSVEIRATGAPGGEAAEIDFPAPHRFGDDASGRSNGYEGDTAFAFTMKGLSPGDTETLTALIMLGVCRDICIPVTASLTTSSAPVSADDAEEIEAAFATLPGFDPAIGRIVSAELAPDRGSVTVAVALGARAENSAADLFLTGPKGWYFGIATARRDGPAVTFTVPVNSRPRHPAAERLAVRAVLTTEAGAIETRNLRVGGVGD
ncbi:protein-disulfide reductase DsbD domain-containing protein [Mangrovicella endophytica]|uniref:protein-disulfide reductase DsbD domain-containing protein n=1 Tax=Mangrovicella endophytica TaxID=2066697 RepID=UPI000C9DAD72|nr:protein-disulfide reductase DsbD domain-containing protein [Mangrovicella endophytica]